VIEYSLIAVYNILLGGVFMFEEENSMIITIDLFSGPFEKLVELIKEKEIPIRKIPLITICKIFDKYMHENLERLNNVSEYMHLSGYLTYLKSKDLLPNSGNNKNFKKEKNMFYSLVEDFELIKETKKIIKNDFGKPSKRYVRIKNHASFNKEKVQDQLDIFLKDFINEHKKLEIIKELYTVEEAMDRIKEENEFDLLKLYSISQKNKLKFIVMFLAALTLVRNDVYIYENGYFIRNMEE
jgi:segregation and condensation protein A